MASTPSPSPSSLVLPAPAPTPTLYVPDEIQVQLVGQTWWHDWGSWVAIGIAFASIILTMVIRHNDNARLRVEVIAEKVVDPTMPGLPFKRRPWVIRVVATNSGRGGSTVVHAFQFKDRAGKYLELSQPRGSSSPLPATLAPGARATHDWDPGQLAAVCVAAGLGMDDLAPWVVYGHRTASGTWREDATQVMRAALKKASQPNAPQATKTDTNTE